MAEIRQYYCPDCENDDKFIRESIKIEPWFIDPKSGDEISLAENDCRYERDGNVTLCYYCREVVEQVSLPTEEVNESPPDGPVTCVVKCLNEDGDTIEFYVSTPDIAKRLVEVLVGTYSCVDWGYLTNDDDEAIDLINKSVAEEEVDSKDVQEEDQQSPEESPAGR